jgi:hypothetical protein
MRILGLGFSLRENPRNGNSRHPVGHPCRFSPFGVFAAQKLQGMVTAGILPTQKAASMPA